MSPDARRRYARKRLRRIRQPYGRRPSTGSLHGGRAGHLVRDFLWVTQNIGTWSKAATAEAEIRSQQADLEEDVQRADHLEYTDRDRRECPLCGGLAYGRAKRWTCDKACRKRRDKAIKRLTAAGLCIFCQGVGCSCEALHLCPTCRGPRALRGGEWGCGDCYRASGRRGRFPVVREPTFAARADNVYEGDVARVAQVGIALRAMASDERWRLRLRALLVYATTPLSHEEVADLANEETWEARHWTAGRVRYAVDQAGTELLRRLRDLPFGRRKGQWTLAHRPTAGRDADEPQLPQDKCKECGIRHSPGTPHGHPVCEQCDIRHAPKCLPAKAPEPRT